MSNKPNIIIPFPCTENWDSMSPTEQGRHCSSCSKSVLDFTNKSNTEILEYFTSTADEVCGRFKNNQFTDNHTFLKQLPQRSRHFLYAVAIIFFGLLLNPTSVEAQIKKPADSAKNCVTIGGGRTSGTQYFLDGRSVSKKRYLAGESIRDARTKGILKVSGNIVDEHNNALSNCTISISQNNINVYYLRTKDKNTFSFEQLPKGNYTIEVSNTEMGTKTFKIYLEENLEANIILHKKKKKSKLKPKLFQSKNKFEKDLDRNDIENLLNQSR